MSSNLLTIGNYCLLEELASGAFGRVHRAKHIYLSERIVAVKLLHAHLSSQRDRESFLHEARILEKLKHPHILPILDVGIHEGTPYMITEFAPHGSLRQHLRRQNSQLLPFEGALRILAQVAQALQTAHQQQIVHRDLKPENILFHANGDALLADFGISTVLSSMSMQQATITGTPPYMAPEQFKGNVSKETDQYSLGCIAYELVTGRLPFTAPDFYALAFKHLTEQPLPPTHFNPDLPEHVSQAILKALAKEHRERYSDAMSFIKALSDTKVQASAEDSQHSTLTPHEVLEQPSGSTSVAAYLKRGAEFKKLKRYEEALAAYEQALRLDPKYVFAHNGKGDVLYDLKRYEEALAAYEQALHLDPKHVSAHYNKGWALKELKRYEEALAAYEQALHLDPKHVFAHRGKGIVLKELKRYEEALVAYDQALRLDPKYVDAHNSKGIVLKELKRYEEALAAYDQALRLDPKYVDAHNSKGAVLKNLKRYEEALVAYDQALRLDPKYVHAHNGKGAVLKNLKRYEEALAAYDQALRLDPKYVFAHNNKGNVLKELKRYEEALAAYDQALRLDPKYVSAHNGKGNVLKELKRYEEALAAYDQALHLDPQNATIYNNKELVLRELKKA